MQRRSFLKKVGLATAGAFAMPYILPSGRLFAATGSRIANHVVLCLFAGGVRNMDSIDKADGNLMPNILRGSESISSDIASSMDALPPAILTPPLQDRGTLFKGFRYANNYPGHFQGHLTALTGNYIDSSVNFSAPAASPTIFEYYRKHNSPSQTAKNAWWVSNSVGENENLTFSLNDDYGPRYGANFFSPLNILTYGNYKPIDLCRSFSTLEQQKMDPMRDFLNNSFRSPAVTPKPFMENDPASRASIQNFLSALATKQRNNQLICTICFLLKK
jgi:hypothetical protein